MTENPITGLPVLPLRDMVVYPHSVHPLFVGTESSIRALDAAMSAGKSILLVAKRDATAERLEAGDVFLVGTLATILQLLKLPDGTVKVLVEGERRARITRLDFDGHYIVADVETVPEGEANASEVQKGIQMAMSQFEEFAQFSKKVPQEVLATLSGIDDPARLIDSIASHMALSVKDRQAVLESFDLKRRIDLVLSLMDTHLDVQRLEKDIRGRVKKQMEKSQREYYLNEQIKAIQKELGDIQEGSNEIDQLAAKVAEARMPKDARNKALAELGKLKLMAPMSAEATVVRGYLDWMLSMPWKKRSRVRRDLPKAQRILDEDHYGLEEVKERIIEYLAVQSRVRRMSGPVLCFVGPPGVGKTSLGESIARATNRKFVRVALGGIRDEAEIRGHRRTYIGSMPGRIVQKMAKAGVSNPLFLLDEVDKMGTDFRGDPASALLEVLDAEQNGTFNDHYLEVDYDLSDVFFVCTSNSLNMPPALLDRMEVIRLPGYTEDEKLNIAGRFLIPKHLERSGLKTGELAMTDKAILHLIRYYTKEAGVRGLEREIAKLARKVVKRKAMRPEIGDIRVRAKDIEKYNGVRRHTYGLAEENNQIGIVTGLAWTEAGGELLNIEAVAVPGKGRQTKTGSLGDVMQESIQAALTFVRSRGDALGVAGDFHEKYDLHIHVPEGATPKDGPSAGIGMCTAMVSVVTGIPVRADVAMTGEITLRGRVLPIGGLKEKLLAAHRGGIRHVVIPEENERDLKEIADNIKENLNIHPVKWMDAVLDFALERMPAPRFAEEAGPPVSGPVADLNADDEPTVNPH
ncbi:MAG: endopeptidase La [Gammaproteobacteria bacterium]|nr:endopeptidase La [Gammaproteobacteria bacterium]